MAVTRFWRVLRSSARVLTETRCSFVGKASPVHFFWGGFDLAVTRFSGRPAPPPEGPAFMREAYKGSHQPRLLARRRTDERPRFRRMRFPKPLASRTFARGRTTATITPGSASSSCRTRRCGPRHRRSVRLAICCEHLRRRGHTCQVGPRRARTIAVTRPGRTVTTRSNQRAAD